MYSIKEIKDLIRTPLEKFDVKRASLFGSIVRCEATEKSDIDLLIEFKGTKSLLDLSRLKIALEEILKCKVDLLTFNSIHPLLKNNILKEQVSIYE